MKNALVITLVAFCAAGCIAAQQVTAQQVSNVPHVVRLSNTFHPANGQPAAPVEGVTLSIYREEREGAPVWQETQNVNVDSEGRYSVLLGATLNDGLPLELFTSGEPRWLGVRFNRPGEVEQTRTLLTSVPYALRASDAETLGGLPASAFLRDPSASSPPGVAAGASATLTPNTPKPRATSGAAGYLGMFTDATDLGNSTMYQYGTRIGLNTTLPLDYMHVAFNDGSGAFTGYAVQNVNPAGFSGMLFYDQNSALAQFQGFGNTTHEYRINNIASGGSINFLIGSSSKLYVQPYSGNVGISNTAPAYALDVAGDLNFSGGLRSKGNLVLYLPGGLSGGNVGVGNALTSVSTGQYNSAIGATALFNDTTGSANTAAGYEALLENTSGSGNTAAGYQVLFTNTTGTNNTALGNSAMFFNTTGGGNTAVGQSALADNSTGGLNTAVGVWALRDNVSGSYNTAIGYLAEGDGGADGNYNIAIGSYALVGNQFGSYNTAIGQNALFINGNGNNNVAIGTNAARAVYSENSNNIHISTQGVSSDNGTIRIGGSAAAGDSVIQTSFFAAGINGVTTGNNDAVPVVIDSNGQLGTISSSRRFKEDIRDMGDASQGLMQLRPVTFRYQKPFTDGSKPLQYGLIAEEVAEVYPDLVARSADGQIETVKYQVLDSMLLNEVQRQQTEIQDLRQQIGELKTLISNITGGSK